MPTTAVWGGCAVLMGIAVMLAIEHPAVNEAVGPLIETACRSVGVPPSSSSTTCDPCVCPPPRNGETATPTTVSASALSEGGATAAAADAADPDADPEYTAMVAWLRKGGATFQGVSGRRSLAGGGRALVATKDLQQGEHLFTIPANFWFSEDTVATGSAIGGLLRTDEVVMRHCRRGNGWGLILALDFERHNRWSPWRGYIDGLPDPTSPITWPEASLKLFQSRHLVKKIKSLRKYIHDKYDELFPYLSSEYPEMFPAELHTLESFTWATLSVWGRAFDVGMWNSTETMWGMMPFADYANHEPYTNNEYSIDVNGYDFAAPQAKDAGDEIFISYGDGKTTYHFLLFYGFVPEGFEAGDYVTITVSKGSAQRLSARLLSENSIVPPELEAALDDTTRLVGFVGADGIVGDELLALFTAVGKGTKSTAAALLNRALQRELDGLPTTLAEDKAALVAKAGIYDDESVALSVCIRFKLILLKMQANLKHWAVHSEWPTGRDERSIIYHFADGDVNMSPNEAASEGLFTIVVDV